MNTQADNLKIRWWAEKPVWVMLFLGFSAGIPILLIFGTLSLWLREAGVSRSTATFFSWAILGYSFKFVWAPLVDRLPVPFLTRWLGRRRSWILVSQLAIISSIALMASTDPKHSLAAMAIAAVCLGFASATQDIVIDAFRIESAEPRLQAMLSSTYIAGYRIGMIAAGSVALFLADSFGSTSEAYSYGAWQKTYWIMAAIMLVGVLTTLVIREPDSSSNKHEHCTADYLKFLLVFTASISAFIACLWLSPSAPTVFSGGLQSVLSFVYNSAILLAAVACAYTVAVVSSHTGLVNQQLVNQSYKAPVHDFFQRYGKLAIWVLLLVGFYRISDIVLGVITNVFYQDMGYSKKEIATLSKAFGVIMTITGSFLGGMVALRIGVMRSLQIAAVLVVITNLLFCWLTQVGQQHTDITLMLPIIRLSSFPPEFALVPITFPMELALVITVDNLVQGLSLAAFIAWLSSLTNVSFTATQYAIFSSLMTLLPKVIGGFSGTIVDSFGYTQFFLFASAIGLPVIALIHFLQKRLEFNQPKPVHHET